MSRVLGFLLLAAACAAAVVFAATVPPPGSPRGDLWKKVEEAQNKGLPKTAIEHLGPIIEGALKDKSYPEAIRAVAHKIALEGNIQGNKPEEKITRMKAEVAKAPPEMRPAMEALLANWYWHYFQHNRYRFLNRTATAAPPGDDFTTWDLPRLFAEIDAQFTKALAAEQVLKETPVAAYDALLEKGTYPDKYRPSLYDFLAHEALAFYQSGEQAGAKAQDAFEIDAATPVFGTADDFLAWKPDATDAASPKLKAIRLYQALLAFHKADADRTAFLDADLHRIQFGKNAAFGEEKTARFIAAAKRFADAHAAHELSAAARFAWASQLNTDGDPAAARTVAQQGATAFPESFGGRNCFNLIAQIEAKTIQVLTERVWAEPLAPVRVQYKNIAKVHLRAVKADWPARLTGDRWRPEFLTDNERKALLAKKPEAEWAADLPATADFKQRTEDVAPPKGLPAGFYFLLASVDPEFREAENQISYADFWVSSLALVMRNEWGNGRLEGFVLKNNAGDPVANATVRTWHRNNNQNKFVPGPTAKTDADGLFGLDAVGQNWLVLAETDGDSLATGNDYYMYKNAPQHRPHLHSVVFTDRALYRPGQTMQFKGIALVADQQKDAYQVLPGRRLTVTLHDPNNKAAGSLVVTTNDYGSFSGSFTAPRDRLTGRMSIRVTGDAPGQAIVNVEEYKRPKFQVTLDAPKEAAKLGGDATVTGKAVGYTGAAVGGAKVRYRVVREVVYPRWYMHHYYWRMPPNHGASQEIAHGTATTAADGSFAVTFPAKPDKSVPEKSDPTFRFTVHADVIDTTGETRSGDRTVVVGYSALQASLTADEWQTTDADVKLTLTTTTLDGEGQAAKVAVKVIKLKPPATVTRPDILGSAPPKTRRGRVVAADAAPAADASDPRTWEDGEVVAAFDLQTDGTGKKEHSLRLPAGYYRAVAEAADKFGKPVSARHQLQVLDPTAAKMLLAVPNVFDAPKWSLEPGQEFVAVWGTGYDRGRAYIEIEHRKQRLQAFWTDPARTQVQVKQAITEAMRGGFTVRVTYVRENRAYLESRHVDVPWTNKHLTVKWDRFVSKLEPAKKETFTATVTGPDAAKAVAEMVAALYDASLDAYKPHHWLARFGVFRQDHANMHSQFENAAKGLSHIAGQWTTHYKGVDARHRSFPHELTVNLWNYQYFRGANMAGRSGGAMPPGAPMSAAGEKPAANGALGESRMMSLDSLAKGKPQDGADRKQADKNGEGGDPGPDLSKVSARKNLNETAFFFPHLTANADGSVKLEFTMPEALTKWKLLGFAHDRDLRSGFITADVVTAKDLMVQPNPPRFLREGDVLEFTVKVSNQSPTRQAGKVRLGVADARSLKSVDAAIGNGAGDQAFDIPAGESKSFAWRLAVPDGLGPVVYTAVGATDRLSDGEEGMLPVLSKRILVTESLPLPIRGMQTKTFDFAKLRESGKSDTLKHQSLTVQMTSQPAWYAVMALPYLMEYPHECSEQTFNRLYANALAQHVAKSDPKIRRVFDMWKNTPALDSPLQKNQDLKAVMLEETPWLRDGEKEAEARRNVGVLFDDNRLTEEVGRGLRKLAEMQHANGMWPWFPGGPDNPYLTLYIATGFGRLRHLGAKVDTAAAVKALTELDAWHDRQYRHILARSKDPEANHLSPTQALYLYGRSFFLADKPVAPPHAEAVEYWKRQARNHWLKLANRQSQAHIAVGLKRFGDRATPGAILASIKERSVSNEEMGLFWRDQEYSWAWFHAPIETQAMMIEALDEVANDAKAVEDAKVWLLKQKQTQNWKTTKATADAVYALLLRGTNLLASDALVKVTLGNEAIKPDNVEAGTGFYEQKFVRGEVKPEFGKVTVEKPDAGVSWGSVHWQYLEDVSKVTPHDGTPLKLEKKLFKKTLTKAGPVLEAVVGPVAVGDEIVCRVVLRTDRDMEYVHLKDHRGSGTEPVSVLSQYKFQDGLYYYESTKDTASHFFIDYLPKGVYVFEYSVRVQHRGIYPSGLASVQCMYAPEFNSHSNSVAIEAK